MERVQQELKWSIAVAVFVTAVVLVTGSPALAQSSGLLASAERVALTMEVEQDETVVRRRRSGGLALTGSALAVAGIVLALRPPVCEISSPTGAPRTFANRWGDNIELEAGLYRGKCDVELTWESVRLGDAGTSGTYFVSTVGTRYTDLHGDHEAVTKRTWNYVGWATAAAGGAMMWFGLRGVDVPVLLHVEPTGGFRVSRSLGW